MPEPTKFEVPTRADGNPESIVEPGSRRLTTERPDATRSGLNQPSGVGRADTAERRHRVAGRVGLAAVVEGADRDDERVVPGDRMVPLRAPRHPPRRRP